MNYIYLYFIGFILFWYQQGMFSSTHISCFDQYEVVLIHWIFLNLSKVCFILMLIFHDSCWSWLKLARAYTELLCSCYWLYSFIPKKMVLSQPTCTCSYYAWKINMNLHGCTCMNVYIYVMYYILLECCTIQPWCIQFYKIIIKSMQQLC